MPDQAIDERFARTLSGDYDSENPWEAVRDLHKLGTREVFDEAVAWCNSSEPLRRARGADVLAQIGTPSFPIGDNPPEIRLSVLPLCGY